MKTVIAIDSFKGSLTSLEAGDSAAAGIHRVFPEAECIVRPLVMEDPWKFPLLALLESRSSVAMA